MLQALHSFQTRSQSSHPPYGCSPTLHSHAHTATRTHRHCTDIATATRRLLRRAGGGGVGGIGDINEPFRARTTHILLSVFFISYRNEMSPPLLLGRPDPWPSYVGARLAYGVTTATADREMGRRVSTHGGRRPESTFRGVCVCVVVVVGVVGGGGGGRGDVVRGDGGRGGGGFFAPRQAVEFCRRVGPHRCLVFSVGWSRLPPHHRRLF